METEGVFAPETLEDAREAYESVGPAAQTVVRETATAMDFDSEEYRERVTSDVVETARDALFASLLVVHVGDFESFADWRADAAVEVTLLGSEDVDNVVWHVAPFADAAVAATYQNERDAAAATCRRSAFGRLYRDAL
ncbi:hypothetical protein DU500_04605 [Haloplanus rubicundus]|uniref:Uncharacterized protein n=1 Tax=Haloplanus rubicundus TaxID=1547898 RepID=A0A345E0Q1_9EURY|nr:DUF5809 family protein [Haloplanus rubicundus]AXG05773.1 hypothetical protein DU500_04605 [Haloplanus rubicundus]AXG09110.1 hypothetical protein DU484_04125 [Haloplanus rubicundus]